MNNQDEHVMIYKKGNYIWSISLLSSDKDHLQSTGRRPNESLLIAHGAIGHKLRTSIIKVNYWTMYSKTRFGRIRTKRASGYVKITSDEAQEIWPELMDRINKQVFKSTIMLVPAHDSY